MPEYTHRSIVRQINASSSGATFGQSLLSPFPFAITPTTTSSELQRKHRQNFVWQRQRLIQFSWIFDRINGVPTYHHTHHKQPNRFEIEIHFSLAPFSAAQTRPLNSFKRSALLRVGHRFLYRFVGITREQWTPKIRWSNWVHTKYPEIYFLRNSPNNSAFNSIISSAIKSSSQTFTVQVNHYPSHIWHSQSRLDVSKS